MTRPSPARLALLLTAAACALAACNPKPMAQVSMGAGGVHVQTQEPADTALVVADRLDCPSEIGALTRTAASADGASCDYTSDKGLVHLAYADNTAGDPKAAVAGLKGQLDAELPGVAEKATIQVVSEKDAQGHKRDKVDMPFLHVEDDASGSHVRLLGINIDSDKSSSRHRHADKDDDDDDDADTTAGNATASSTPPEKRGVELVYVLVSGKPSPQGFHVAGYIAKGPPTGKLVVATFRYRSDKSFNQNDRHDNDIDRLIALNAKPA